MSEFIVGIEEKYPKALLKGRVSAEGSVVSCFMADMLFLDEVDLNKDDFITVDGRFYYSMLRALRDKGFYSLDEVTILSNLSESVLDAYEDRGGWETIQHQIDIINTNNFDTYLDILYRENILCNMCRDGFNLIDKIDIDGKMTPPLKLFRSMTAEQVTEWYEARLESYGTGYSSKILEEEEIAEFSDEFIAECEEGIENGVPLDIAGYDTLGEEIYAFPFLSRQISGLLEGTFTMIGGYSSSGKSTLMITVLMALLHRGRKILIITNEEDVKRFKIKFLVWNLAKHNHYYKLTKKRLTAGDITTEDRNELKEVQDYWKENFSKKVKIISVADANMGIVKKKIRENVLRYGYDTVFYDTFKIQEEDFNSRRQDLALVKDSRDLHKLAKKYNIIMLASLQLAEYTKGTLFLTAAQISNAKQIKEILENLFLMRNVYNEELDPKSKYYINPFRLVKKEDKWIEEAYEISPNRIYKLLFVEKCRNGKNSSDTGVAYLLSFDGDHCIFKETAQARPRHGEIR